MKQTDNYTYRITWSEEDKEYIGLCAEFPSLSWLADTQEAALQGIINLVAEAVSDMRANNETVPQPIAARRFSGRLLVRIPPEVHKELTIEAAEAGVSINRIISARLAKA
ncbi:MAG: toxin-antitoxin system HicB family antitoxin [Dehalococcoidia bacterium]|nr:toxin-antitoxin system HicB family antitoxin [Dehalococcoidia bacterium]